MKTLLRVFGRFLSEADREEILGDLEEGHRRRVDRMGRAVAGLWLLRQILGISTKLAWYRSTSWPGKREGRASSPAFRSLEDGLRDVRFGLRGLRKRPVFALAAVVTLAVGVGMTTTMFTLVDAILLRPLPGENAGRMVYLGLETADGRASTSPTPELIRLLRDHATSFSRIEAYAMTDFSIVVDGEPLRVRGALASEGFFSFLGVRAGAGRIFLPGDGSGSQAPVAVLSHTFWSETFGEDPGVLGQVITVGDGSYEVVGVLPRDFRVDTPAEALLWIPEGAAGALFDGHVPLEGALASLAEGVSLDVARAEMDAIVRNNPLTRRGDRDWVGRVYHPEDLTDPSLERAILLLQLGAVLVLLVACGNLTNLLLARGEARTRELAVRASLGAGRSRLIRQLLSESAALGVLGGVGGILLTAWALDALPLFLPPGYAGFTVSGPVFLFSMGISMAAVLGAGLLPALRGSTRNLAQAAKGRIRRRGGFPGRIGVRQGLVSLEVAMALVLLVSASLLLRTVSGLMDSDMGFQREDLMSLRMEIPEDRYPEEDARLRFLQQLEDALRTGFPPELGTATVASGLVEGLSVSIRPVAAEGAPEAPEDPQVLLVWSGAANYPEVLGVPVVAGRWFSEGEASDEEEVVVVNERLARRYFPGGDAVGRRLRLNENWYRIVGVAGSVDLPSLAWSPLGELQLFFPIRQTVPSGVDVLARVTTDRSTAVDRLKEAIRTVDPTLPIQVSLVDDALAESLGQERSNAVLMLLFAMAALILGAVGIYGVMAYSVGRQIREIGIRVALGATRGGEVGRVVLGGMTSVGIGLGLGILGLVAASPMLAGFLYEVDGRDPAILSACAAIIGAIALVSAWLPARRATGSGPVAALKGE